MAKVRWTRTGDPDLLRAYTRKGATLWINAHGGQGAFIIYHEKTVWQTTQKVSKAQVEQVANQLGLI